MFIMTKAEFDKIKWESGMQCIVDGDIHDIWTVDLEYRIVTIKDDDGEHLPIPYKFLELKK